MVFLIVNPSVRVFPERKSIENRYLFNNELLLFVDKFLKVEQDKKYQKTYICLTKKLETIRWK